MTDHDVRGLERRWLATGAVDDGAAWLAAALRAGQVERGAVDLAAYVGHAAARAVARAPAFAVEDVRAWVEGLDGWGHARLVQAAHASASLAGGALGEARPLLAAVEAWLACPCAEHRLASLEASRRLRAGDARRRRRRRPEMVACVDATLTVMRDAARARAGTAAASAVEACGAPAVIRVVQRAVSPIPFPDP